MNSEEWGAGDIIMAEHDPALVKMVIGIGAGKFASVWATLDASAFYGGIVWDSMNDLRLNHKEYIRIGGFTYDCMKEIEDVFTAPYREGKD